MSFVCVCAFAVNVHVNAGGVWVGGSGGWVDAFDSMKRWQARTPGKAHTNHPRLRGTPATWAAPPAGARGPRRPARAGSPRTEVETRQRPQTTYCSTTPNSTEMTPNLPPGFDYLRLLFWGAPKRKPGRGTFEQNYPNLKITTKCFTNSSRSYFFLQYSNLTGFGTCKSSMSSISVFLDLSRDFSTRFPLSAP